MKKTCLTIAAVLVLSVAGTLPASAAASAAAPSTPNRICKIFPIFCMA